jgi:serine/threonine protein phosphatase 1
MFFHKISRRRGPAGSAAPRVPDGLRVYAIGDVHGRIDLLDRLLERIERDSAGRAAARTQLVLLGDIIDRGPDSRRVIERLLSYSLGGTKPILLCGNHEEVLLRVLSCERGILDSWLTFGGTEFLLSYGLDPLEFSGLSEDDALVAVGRVVPREHLKLLESSIDSVKIGDFLFVHAGIRPHVELAMQSQRDLRWIRHAFLDDPTDHGLIVVHGHTISAAVEDRANRIGLDTGAYRSGRLSAVGLEGDARWFLEGSVIQAIDVD